MNIVLLGKDGQVGRELSRVLLPLGELTALGRAEVDLNDLLKLKRILEQIKPTIIVNAAAYTSVDNAENDKFGAYKINQDVVSILADYARLHNAILIHYSTDYVFDGRKQEAYLESDPANPLNVYGASKLAGEQAILDSGCRGYIFRTSWVYAPCGKNFVNTILSLAKQRETLAIVNDQYGSPTSAEFISDVSLLAIIAAREDKLKPGIYHLTSSGLTTWYEFACFIIEESMALGIQFKLNRSTLHPIASEAYPLPALRPKNSVLNNVALSSELKITMPNWTIYAKRMLNQLIQSKVLV